MCVCLCANRYFGYFLLLYLHVWLTLGKDLILEKLFSKPEERWHEEFEGLNL